MSIALTNRQRLVRINTRLLSQLAEDVLRLLNAGDDELSIVLVNDKQMAELNGRFHHVAGPTDVLSFDYGDATGELIISVERAVAHAKRYRTKPARELALYVVHGLLHLHGYDDRAPRPRARMRAAERRLLAQAGRSFDLRKIVRSE